MKIYYLKIRIPDWVVRKWLWYKMYVQGKQLTMDEYIFLTGI